MNRPLPKPPKIVDLHVEAFLDDWQDYDSDELIAITLDYFRENLDAAIYWSMPQISFIHGKGKGVLKNLIYEDLREYRDSGTIANYYPSYHNEDIVVVAIGI